MPTAIEASGEAGGLGVHEVPFGTDPGALSYVCAVCDAQTHRDAGRCSRCGARFAGVGCGNCGVVDEPGAFDRHVCPSCGVVPATVVPVDPEGASLDDLGLACVRCGQAVGVTHVTCRACGHQPRELRIGWAVVAVGLVVILPLLATRLGEGSPAVVAAVGGLVLGGALALMLVREEAVARQLPRRVLVWAALGWVAWSAVVVDLLQWTA